MLETDVLRVLAILLITNSHLDALYPIPGLASGGALGNSLFFMLSGLGLSLSNKASEYGNIFKWIFYRLSRIYPPLWVVLFCQVVFFHLKQPKNIFEYGYHIFYPTDFWFISALVCFYVLTYPILRFNMQRWVHCIILVLMIPYFLIYFGVLDLHHFSVESKGYFKWIFYYQVMLFGIWLAPIYLSWKEKILSNKLVDFVSLALVFLLYIALKFTMAHGYMLPVQFLVQWITLIFVYLALKCSFYIAKWINLKILVKLIALLASITLEVYLLQASIYNSGLIAEMPFPYNLVLFWGIVLPFAWLVHYLSNPLQKALRKMVSLEKS